MPFEQGPYLQVAALCEKVLQERDGVFSLIRVIDRITHTEMGPQAPEHMPTVKYALQAIVLLKSGVARGRHQLKIELEAPSGIKGPSLEMSLFLEGEDRGTAAVLPMEVAFEQEGLYWFTIYLNDQFLTRIPLRLVYNRVLTGPS